MKIKILVCLICFLFCVPVVAQKKPVRETRALNIDRAPTESKETPSPLAIEDSPQLQALVKKAVAETLNKFSAKNLTEDKIAISLVDLTDPNKLQSADFRGEFKIYPASVVKMFYLAAAHRWLENGKIKMTPEFERGLRDMIVDSSNDATGYVVDVLSNVSSGAELPEKEFQIWAEKREAVQRYFDSLGYQNINIKQKTFCEDAYGREQQFRGRDGVNRNKLTTNATARLLAEIALGKVVTPARSKQMMDLMQRDWEKKDNPDEQATGFTALGLTTGAKLWSKAGWTSKTRHDAAYIETPEGKKIVIVVFTEDFAGERDIIPTVTKIVLSEIGQIK